MTYAKTIPRPTRLEDLDAATLTALLHTGGALDPASSVTGYSTARAGAGQVAALHRLTLVTDGPGPDTVMAKVASADTAAREFAAAAGLYAREVRFYEELARTLPIRTPTVLAVCATEDVSEFLLLLEDLAPAEQVDQLTGCSPDQAALALAQAAALHSRSWRDSDVLGRDWLRSGARMWQGAGAQIEGLVGAFEARFSDVVEDEYLALARSLPARVGEWLALLEDPRCLWHGDFRLDNLCFGARSGEIPIAVFDWQTVTVGPPGLDVAYFLGAGLSEDTRRTYEDRLVREYHAGLLDGGVRDYGWDQCWRDYGAHALCGFLGALIGAAQAERSERGDRMLATMARRHGRHVLDLDNGEQRMRRRS